MKKLLLGAAAAAMTFAGFAASAQPYYGHSYGGAYVRHDGDRRDWNRNRYASYRYDRYDRDDRRHDRGDTAGAAILGGVVGLMLGTALADHNTQPAYGYSYSRQPYGYGYQPYGYNNGYGYNSGYNNYGYNSGYSYDYGYGY